MKHDVIIGIWRFAESDVEDMMFISSTCVQMCIKKDYKMYKTTQPKKVSDLDCSDELEMNLQVTGGGGVPRGTFGWQVEVRVRAVEEGFPPLAVREVGRSDQTSTRTGLGVQRTAAHRQPILHIETMDGEDDVLELHTSR